MPTYRVWIDIPAVLSGNVIVEAASEDAAEELVKQQLRDELDDLGGGRVEEGFFPPLRDPFVGLAEDWAEGLSVANIDTPKEGD